MRQPTGRLFIYLKRPHVDCRLSGHVTRPQLLLWHIKEPGYRHIERIGQLLHVVGSNVYRALLDVADMRSMTSKQLPKPLLREVSLEPEAAYVIG